MAGPLDLRWNHGVRRWSSASEPPIQVHAYDERTVILRQSKSTNFEAPFLYLLFGEDRALLLDTGAVADPAVVPLRETVDGLIADWLRRHPRDGYSSNGSPRDGYSLVVAHTHGHGDHIAADAQFADRPDTVVAKEPEAVRTFFGFDDARWPDEEVQFDLGGRSLPRSVRRATTRPGWCSSTPRPASC